MTTDLDTSLDAAPSAPLSPSSEECRAIADRWLQQVGGAVAARDGAQLAGAVLETASWRDLVALTGDIRSAMGLESISELVSTTTAIDVGPWTASADNPPAYAEPAPGFAWVQVHFDFTTGIARARGIVRLVEVPGAGWQALMVVTEMDAPRHHVAPTTTWSSVDDPAWTKAQVGRPNWQDARDHRSLDQDELDVLVLGGGQSGLAMSAYLQHLGLSYLTVERHARVGDSWRERHYNLITHTASFTDHFPFLPFPTSWPISAQKDKLANWCEFYAGALDLNVWTSTEATSAAYDEGSGRWSVELRGADGTVRSLRPRHLVLASGLLTVPKLPDLGGRDSFPGEVMHSSQYRSGEQYVGRKVVVVGTGASGHDIAQNLVEQGVEDVTLVQRSSTYVMSFLNGTEALWGAAYSDRADLRTADLEACMAPLPVAAVLAKPVIAAVAEMDAELLEGLRSIGFVMNSDGILANAIKSGGVSGYYINQGASDLLIEGRIGFHRGNLVGLDETGMVFEDGAHLDADVVVLCTGYQNMRHGSRALLGDDVVDQVPDVWVPDPSRGGEHSVLWSDSGYPHLWFTAGSLLHARVYSKYLALRLWLDVDAATR